MNTAKRTNYYPLPANRAATGGCNGMFIAGRCYRCEIASSTVTNAKHPLYKRMCTDCKQVKGG